MGRSRKGSESRLTAFRSLSERTTTNKFPGRCSKCSLYLKPGDGYVTRAPRDKKWDLTCKNGCEELPYHRITKEHYEQDRAEIMEEEGEGLTPPWTTVEELRAEHGQ